MAHDKLWGFYNGQWNDILTIILINESYSDLMEYKRIIEKKNS